MVDETPPAVIDLEGIRLRRPRLSDAEAIFEYGSDIEVARFADWPVRTSVESVIESIQERAALWDAGVEFSWVIATADEDVAIGGVFCKISEDGAEVGFLVDRRYWGRGYATQAAGAVLSWVYSNSSISRVWATCDVENVASIRVLEKHGFVRERRLDRAIVRPQISDLPRDAYLYSCRSPSGP
ncbi:MAG: GNAT family N-acetyltransferase [Verrucomicrobiota bacterium]